MCDPSPKPFADREPSGSRLVFETPWFGVEERPSRPEWNIGTAPFYQIVGPDSVLTIPVLPDGRLVMVRQYRPARGAHILELPAGVIDPGESPAEAARRELLEETGYVVGELVGIGRSGINLRDALTSHIFVGFAARQVQDEVERGIETLLVAPRDIAGIVRAEGTDMLATLGAIFMAKAILGDRFPDLW